MLGVILVKGGSMILALFTMPAYMKYFEEQSILGFWFTLLSVLSWILNFDLGIGNGLRNKLVEAIAKKDHKKAKKYISTSYILIGIIIIILIVMSMVIFPYINWNDFFNIDKTIISQSVMLKAVQIVFVGLLLQFLFKLITSILYAIQKSAIPNFLTLMSTLLQLLYVLIAKGNTIEQNLINLSIVNVLSVNIPLIVATIIVFSKQLKECRVNIKYFDIKYGKEIMSLGGTFFWVQIMYMILMNTNEIFITKFFSADKVVDYQIYNKLFTIVGTFFNLALTPIWSAVTKALSEGKKEWIYKLYRKLKQFSAIGIIAEFVFIFMLQFVVNIWLRENAIQINYVHATIFAIFGSVFILNAVLSSIANGMRKIKNSSNFLYTRCNCKNSINNITK